MKVLDVEKYGTRTARWYVDEDGNRVRYLLATEENVAPVIERNKAEYNSAPKRYEDDVFNKVASFPLTVIDHMCKVHDIEYRELMNMKSDKAVKIWNLMLNDPDLRHFRTRPGEVRFKQR